VIFCYFFNDDFLNVDGDDGMTHRVLIFSLCGLESRNETIEGMIKAHERNQLARPGVKTWRTLQGLEGEDLVELELV
jgi:hypothetical protein